MEAHEQFLQYRRIIEDFTSKTLAAIPSDLGRLIHVVSLRDLATGRYQHAGLAAIYSEPAVHEALAYCHDQLFKRILETPLEEQERDLRICLRAFPSPTSEIAARWLEQDFCSLLVPLGAPGYLRELFCSNLRVLLRCQIQERVTQRRSALPLLRPGR